MEGRSPIVPRAGPPPAISCAMPRPANCSRPVLCWPPPCRCPRRYATPHRRGLNHGMHGTHGKFIHAASCIPWWVDCESQKLSARIIKMTKQERESVLIDVCRFIQEGLRNEIQEWNMSNIHNVTIGVRRYQRYGEYVRLSKRHGNKCIDLYVYIRQTQGAGQALRNALIARKNEYMADAPQGTEVEWNNYPQGDNSQCLVHYYVPLDWDNWDTLSEQQKNVVLDAFRALHNVANDVIGHMGNQCVGCPCWA